MKPKCPHCNSKKWINTMVYCLTRYWFLCSRCGWDNFKHDLKCGIIKREDTA